MEFKFAEIEESLGWEVVRDRLIERMRLLKSKVDVVDGILEKEVLNQGDVLGDALDGWDTDKEELEQFLVFIRAVIKYSGRTTAGKAWLKTGETGKLKKLRIIHETDEESGKSAESPEFNVLFAMGTFNGLSSTLGWVTFAHDILDEIETNFDGFVMERLKNRIVRDVHAGYYDDFMALVEAEFEKREKRKAYR